MTVCRACRQNEGAPPFGLCPVCDGKRIEMQRQGHKKVQLGSAVESITKRLGIPTCGGCVARRDAMNKIDPTGKTAVEFFKALTSAIINPEGTDEKEDHPTEARDPEGSRREDEDGGQGPR